MKAMFPFLGLAAALVGSPATSAVCPAIGASSGCSVVITRAADNTFSVVTTGVGPYDGADDTLVGVVNNGLDYLLSLNLSSSTDIFGFEGDGLSAFTGTFYGPTGYEGPNTSFSVVDAFNGTVNFLNGGLAPGTTAYFSLEEDLSGTVGGTSGTVTVGGGVTGSVPEPATWAMFLTGFGLVGSALRQRRTSVAVA